MMSILLSVNLVAARHSGIDGDRQATGPVQVRAPRRKGIGGSGLVGDRVYDLRHHGGDYEAVYAHAREDLVRWSAELDRPLQPGSFRENLTTVGVNVADALIGERWRIGRQAVLEVCSPRIRCRTFAGWLGERGWVKRFTQRGSQACTSGSSSPASSRPGSRSGSSSVPTTTSRSGSPFEP
jgi:MOSC domain-containing protein YiiM